MKKIVILAAFLLLITGCSVGYKLTINEDATVFEEANLSGTDKFFETYYKTTKKNVLKSFLDIYKDVLSDNKYNYELIEADTPYVYVNKKYNSVKEYVDSSKLFNGYFDEVKYTEDGNLRKIETIGFNENNVNDPDRFSVSKMSIAIKCAYEVENHNAVSVDSNTNTYYYKFDEESDHKIILEYNIAKKFNANKNMIMQLIVCAIILLIIWIYVYYSDKKKTQKK